MSSPPRKSFLSPPASPWRRKDASLPPGMHTHSSLFSLRRRNHSNGYGIPSEFHGHPSTNTTLICRCSCFSRKSVLVVGINLFAIFSPYGIAAPLLLFGITMGGHLPPCWNMIGVQIFSRRTRLRAPQSCSIEFGGLFRKPASGRHSYRSEPRLQHPVDIARITSRGTFCSRKELRIIVHSCVESWVCSEKKRNGPLVTAGFECV